MEKKIKIIYSLILGVFSLTAFAGEFYKPPKLWLKNSNKVKVGNSLKRGPAASRGIIKGTDLDSDLVTLEEIRGKKGLKKVKFWKYEIKN